MYKPGGTIAAALGRIQQTNYVLPAISARIRLETRADRETVRQSDAGLPIRHVPVLEG